MAFLAVMLSAPAIGVEDWDRLEMPDGYRAEVIRGELVVSPSPVVAHGRVQLRLGVLLASCAPTGYEPIVNVEWRQVVRGIVAMAPQPDLIIVRRDAQEVSTAPMLGVEVLSPSDRHRLVSGETRIEGKRLDYAASGLRHHLEIDPVGPVAMRYELVDGVLVEVGRASGMDVLASDVPFPYRFSPLDLTRP